MHSIHLLLAFTTSSFAARLLVSIPSSPNLQNPAVLPSSTHATLSAHGQPLSALLTKSNTFSFDDVPPESYILNVHCRDYAFEPLRIDVTKNESAGGEYVQAWQTFRGNEWENKGEARGEGPSSSPVHIEVKAMAARVFYEKRGGCKSKLLWLFPGSALTKSYLHSLGPFIPEVANDSHGSLQHGTCFRHALSS